MARDKVWKWRAHAMHENPTEDSPTVVLLLQGSNSNVWEVGPALGFLWGLSTAMVTSVYHGVGVVSGGRTTVSV